MLRWIYMASAMDKTIQLEISWPCSHHCYTLGLCCECLGGRRERTRAGEGGRGVGAIRRDSPEHGNPPTHTHRVTQLYTFFLSSSIYIPHYHHPSKWAMWCWATGAAKNPTHTQLLLMLFFLFFFEPMCVIIHPPFSCASSLKNKNP